MISMVNRFEQQSPFDVKQILIANSPITRKVMKVIQSSDYLLTIRDSIMPYQKGVSPRTEKEQELNYYSFQSNLKTVLLKQAYLDISNLDSLASVSQKDSTIMGNLKLIGVLINKKDYVNAQAVLNEIYTKEGAFLSDQTKLSAMNLILAQQNKSWFDLPDSLMKVVQLIYDNNPETSVNARAILALTKGLQYDRYPYDLNDRKNKSLDRNLNTTNVKQTYLKIYPNPSMEFTNIEIRLAEENSRSGLEIYNSLGSLVEKHDVNDNDLMTINTKEYRDGVYLVLLKTNSNVIEKQKLVISH